MDILAIETTGPVGSVAVISVDRSCSAAEPADCACAKDSSAGSAAGGGAAITSGMVPMKITTQTMSHLKNLIPMAAELLEEEHINKEEICAVAASVGPGSFTGIRIGVSTARALAQAWSVPCISVPTLELFREKSGVSKDPDGSVCVIFNARRGQVYGACYGKDGKALIEPGPYMLDEVLAKIDELGAAPVFYGDGVDAYFDKDEFRDRVSGYAAAPESERYQTADMTARYALAVWNENKVVTYEELLPDYMRESEAEQRLKDGSLEKMRKAKMERFMKMAGKQA